MAAARRRKGPIERGLFKSLRLAGVGDSPELAAVAELAKAIAVQLDVEVGSGSASGVASLSREYRNLLGQLGIGVAGAGAGVESGGGVDPVAARSVAALDELRARRRGAG
jgi:hypothetical protein